MRTVKAASFRSRMEAGIAAGILDSRGIAYVIQADDIGIFGPGHQGPISTGVDLLVAEAELALVRQLLEDAGVIEES